MIQAAAFAFVSVFLPAFEDGEVISSMTGDPYRVVCTQDGFDLISAAPVSRFVEGQDSTELRSQTEHLELRTDGSAFSEILGPGTWDQDASGIHVSLARAVVDFPGIGAGCAG